MDYEVISSILLGAGTTLALASPAEWAIHKYLLHGPRELRRRFSFVDNASRGHNDIHHRAYRGPAHYFRDETNEREVIHFSPKDVGVIAGIAVGIGVSVAEANALIQNGALEMSWRGGMYVLGTTLGAMLYYLAYEGTHHLMHVKGDRRMGVSRKLGDIIQGGADNRDGKLRLSKPLLDDVEEKVLKHADSNSRDSTFEPPRNLASRLEMQLTTNLGFSGNNIPNIAVEPTQASEVLQNTAQEVLDSPRNYSLKDRIYHKATEIMRRSRVFEMLDGHHFVHHRNPSSNLNVVVALMDWFKRTKKPSSISVLESDTRYWLCPNSPDTKPFKRPVRA